MQLRVLPKNFFELFSCFYDGNTLHNGRPTRYNVWLATHYNNQDTDQPCTRFDLNNEASKNLNQMYFRRGLKQWSFTADQPQNFVEISKLYCSSICFCVQTSVRPIYRQYRYIGRDNALIFADIISADILKLPILSNIAI